MWIVDREGCWTKPVHRTVTARIVYLDVCSCRLVYERATVKLQRFRIVIEFVVGVGAQI